MCIVTEVILNLDGVHAASIFFMLVDNFNWVVY